MWHHLYSSQLTVPPFASLEQLFNLTKYKNWILPADLNRLSVQFAADLFPEFVDQDSLAHESLYYEQIIAQRGIVPTRKHNWHDLFNGFIWLQFPKCKWLLNQLHIEQIEQHGLTPRTPVRDRITHFDECGLVLAYTAQDLTTGLSEHQWTQTFLQQKALWGTQIKAFVFGHAILEMLLQPFIGLTGKWIGIQVENDFFNWSTHKQNQYVDRALAEKIRVQDTFAYPKPAKPIPILGIPEWHQGPQDANFYANKAYFMPKKSQTGPKSTR